MKSKLLVFSIAALMIGTSACKQKETVEQTQQEVKGDTSKNSLDWEGTYTGVIPCADCPGIFIRLDLGSDDKYKMEQTYQKGGMEAIKSEGKFTWSADGSTITLEQVGQNDFPSELKVGENKLTIIGKDGKEIAGELAPDYILTKVNKDLVEKYWKLTELMGQPVTYKEGQGKEAFMTLKMEGNRVHGNLGCNSFNGTYELKPGNRIKFSQMASTMMMCMNMETETKFNEILQQADNYNLNGDTLVLNKAKMAPLARFQAVYM